MTTTHLIGMLQSTHRGRTVTVRHELQVGVTPSFQFGIHAGGASGAAAPVIRAQEVEHPPPQKQVVLTLCRS
jgi:hypothetical protein